LQEGDPDGTAGIEGHETVAGGIRVLGPQIAGGRIVFMAEAEKHAFPSKVDGCVSIAASSVVLKSVRPSPAHPTG
jgi:hypothetical protein